MTGYISVVVPPIGGFLSPWLAWMDLSPILGPGFEEGFQDLGFFSRAGEFISEPATRRQRIFLSS